MLLLNISPLTVPVLMTAGIMFYVGLSHILICRRRQNRHLDFMFSLSCFAMGLYDLFCAGLYSAASAREGLIWQQAQIVALSFFSASLFWFVADYTGKVSRRALVAATAYFLVSGVVGMFSSQLFFHPDRPADKHLVFPYDIHITIFEASPGILTGLQSAVGLVVLVYALVAAVRFHREAADRRRSLRLVEALTIFAIGVVNDSAVALGLYVSVYVMEYAYVAIVLVMAAALSREVAAQEVMQSHLDALENRFEAVFKNVTVGIALTDTEGKLMRVNSALAAMVGLPVTVLRGISLFDLLHPTDAAVARASLQDLLDGDILSFRDELRYMRPDGTEFWGDISAGLIRGPEDHIEAVTWLVVGVTERRRAAQELQILNERLEEKVFERTEALTETNTRLSDSLTQLRKDEEAAKLIQFNLLPHERRTILGVEFSRHLQTSAFMSGDFVDYFQIDDRHLAFYTADVAGHGASSAFVTVLLNSLVAQAREHFLVEQDLDLIEPSRVLEHLNAELLKQDTDKHVVIFFAVLDVELQRLAYAGAGQFPPPLLKMGSDAIWLESDDSPLGMFDGAQYKTHTREVPGPFSMLLCSDGILDVLPQEALDAKLEYLESIMRNTQSTLPNLVREIGLLHIENPSDDITLMMVKRRVVA